MAQQFCAYVFSEMKHINSFTLPCVSKHKQKSNRFHTNSNLLTFVVLLLQVLSLLLLLLGLVDLVTVHLESSVLAFMSEA